MDVLSRLACVSSSPDWPERKKRVETEIYLLEEVQGAMKVATAFSS
jgi:hypothetical protein